MNSRFSVGSTSGTVRLLTDLAAIGQPIDKAGVKLIFDRDGNMAMLHSSGPSIEALKAHWARAFVGKIVDISSKTETSEDRKTGKTFTYSVRQVLGLHGSGKSSDAGSVEDAPPPEEEEAAY